MAFTKNGNYLDFCSRLPRYSLNNQILIMLQKPDATMCQSFTGWKEMGRFVKKGEKGIRVLAPAPFTVEKEQNKLQPNGKPVRDLDGEPVKEIVEVKVMAFKPVSTLELIRLSILFPMSQAGHLIKRFLNLRHHLKQSEVPLVL